MSRLQGIEGKKTIRSSVKGGWLPYVGRFMAMSGTPVLEAVQRMFDQEGAGMGGLLQEIVSSKHAF